MAVQEQESESESESERDPAGPSRLHTWVTPQALCGLMLMPRRKEKGTKKEDITVALSVVIRVKSPNRCRSCK
jgi:hypothetical protein